MKFFGYILRNASRNRVRSALTIASTAISLFLMMILVSYMAIMGEVSSTVRVYNRVIAMSSNGFAGRVPIARVREVGAMDGVLATTPFVWVGGKFGEEVLPFAQFAVDADTIIDIYPELKVPADQLKAFKQDRTGCLIGRKLAKDRHFKVGDKLPIKADLYPFDLDLTIRGVYDGPEKSDNRMCMLHWDYLDELVKKSERKIDAGNAGIVVAKCASADMMPGLCKRIDASYANSDAPTRSLTEEAFGKLFADMVGDLAGMIRSIGFAVVFSLLCVAGNALAMALRERTTEIAVLKAIGFQNGLVLMLVLAEAMVVTGVGGVIGALGSKAFFDAVDVSKYSLGALPFFFVPWNAALLGVGVSIVIGFVSGLVPAYRAAHLSVINGLRKVV